MPLFQHLFYVFIWFFRFFLAFYLKMRRLPLPCRLGVLNRLNLCTLFYRKQMSPCLSLLDLMVQFPDIMRNRQQDTLRFTFTFPRYKNLRNPVSSFRSPKLPSAWILRFTRNTILRH